MNGAAEICIAHLGDLVAVSAATKESDCRTSLMACVEDVSQANGTGLTGCDVAMPVLAGFFKQDSTADE
jgi:hypothetical protein